MKKLERVEELSRELNWDLEYIIQGIKFAKERQDLDSVNYWYNELIVALNDKIEDFKEIINN